jgi:predicted nucleotidyltransferase
VLHLREYLAELVRRTSSVLDDQLVGVYLHGSAAMDAFVPSRSDVDVLVVTTSAVAAEARHTLAEALTPTALPYPGVGLELSVVTSASSRAHRRTLPRSSCTSELRTASSSTVSATLAILTSLPTSPWQGNEDRRC